MPKRGINRKACALERVYHRKVEMAVSCLLLCTDYLGHLVLRSNPRPILGRSRPFLGDRGTRTLSVCVSGCLSVCLSCPLVGIGTTFWLKLAARIFRTSQTQLPGFHHVQLYKNHSIPRQRKTWICLKTWAKHPEFCDLQRSLGKCQGGQKRPGEANSRLNIRYNSS